MKVPLRKIVKPLLYFSIGIGILAILLLNIDVLKNIKYFEDPVLIREWIKSYGDFSSVAFILLQIVQVIIFFIPGEVIQVAGGFIFGAFWGFVLSMIGIVLGSLLTFLIARTVGERILRKIIPDRHFVKLEALINKPRNKLILFILYLIPGVPKDILGYVSGITPIGTKEFILISSSARIPGILASVFLGSKLYDKNYVMVIAAVLMVVIIFAVVIFYKEKIINKFK